MTYRERLYIPWWWSVIALLFWLSLAVAVLAYVPAGPAIWFSALAALGIGLALVAYSRTLVAVGKDTFTAGRYRLTGEYIADVVPLMGEAARRAAGPAGVQWLGLTRRVGPGRPTGPGDSRPCRAVGREREL